MTAVTSSNTDPLAGAGLGEHHDAPAKKGLGVVFWICVAILVIVAAWAIFDGLLPFPGENKQGDGGPNEGPSSEHWFGTDNLGRDVFARTVEGARFSIQVAFVGTLVGMGVGGLFGLLAGYFKGRTDSLVSGLIAIMLSVPALVLVTFIVAVNGRSRVNVTFAVCILAIPGLARIVRGSTLQYADREFVQAAKIMGAKNGRIIFREIFPNVVPTMVSFAFLTFGIIIVVETTLSFLGLSLPAGEVTWGSIIAGGRDTFRDAPHVVLLPSLVVFLTVISLNFVGDRLLQRLDIRESML